MLQSMGSQRVGVNLGTEEPQEYQQSLHLLWAYPYEEAFKKYDLFGCHVSGMACGISVEHVHSRLQAQ